MSYRAFKRLLGETSLERKCRFLFGAFILLLITGSFWLYARQTEHLAYDQLDTTSRLLVPPIVARWHLKERDRVKAVEEFKSRWEEQLWPERLRQREPRFIGPNSSKESDRDLFNKFASGEYQNEHSQLLLSQGEHHYYAAIRASASCVGCHQKLEESRANQAGEEAAARPVRENDLLAILEITMPTESIENEVHFNRAVLISTALVAALLIMGGAYLIVRYVIVKPVKHLKEVSDAIAAGELNVRSEIQTGDEFEDLSHAFNRMLRNLVSMQDRLRKVNADLDRKVDELAQANMALYESNRLKSDFLATMSHELRTPLNSILGFSEVLLSGNQLSEKQHRWVRNIQSSGERLLNLINDILDLAKIEAGKMQVRLADFSVYDLAEGLLTMFRPMAEKKNIDLKGQFEPGIPVLRQDGVKLQQILSNLLSNATKFTPEGGRVQFKVEADSVQVVFTVADTGVGIAPEEQDLVFEKFRQGGNPLTREHAGTGLGLSIVRELSKLLGGEVTLQSELGRGSTFTVRLPLQLSEEPRLEFDLAHEGIDLSKAQRVDVRLYAAGTPPTQLESSFPIRVDGALSSEPLIPSGEAKSSSTPGPVQ
jgi:signal transduction histidine kinase